MVAVLTEAEALGVAVPSGVIAAVATGEAVAVAMGETVAVAAGVAVVVVVDAPTAAVVVPVVVLVLPETWPPTETPAPLREVTP